VSRDLFSVDCPMGTRGDHTTLMAGSSRTTITAHYLCCGRTQAVGFALNHERMRSRRLHVIDIAVQIGIDDNGDGAGWLLFHGAGLDPNRALHRTKRFIATCTLLSVSRQPRDPACPESVPSRTCSPAVAACAHHYRCRRTSPKGFPTRRYRLQSDPGQFHGREIVIAISPVTSVRSEDSSRPA